MIEEDKEIRAGFPMHHSTLTEITKIRYRGYINENLYILKVAYTYART